MCFYTAWLIWAWHANDIPVSIPNPNPSPSHSECYSIITALLWMSGLLKHDCRNLASPESGAWVYLDYCDKDPEPRWLYIPSECVYHCPRVCDGNMVCSKSPFSGLQTARLFLCAHMMERVLWSMLSISIRNKSCSPVPYPGELKTHLKPLEPRVSTYDLGDDKNTVFVVASMCSSHLVLPRFLPD